MEGEGGKKGWLYTNLSNDTEDANNLDGARR